MAYRQPRVPEYREDGGAYMKALTLFLKDFCTAAWTANNQRIREIEALKARMDSMEKTGKEGA